MSRITLNVDEYFITNYCHVIRDKWAEADGGGIYPSTSLKRRGSRGDSGKLEAVHGVTRAVPQESVLALLGPNCAGKSTAIKMLINAFEPTSGAARALRVGSRKLGEKEKAQIGYVS